MEMSAIQKKGFKKIFNSINKLIEKSKKKYSTSQLNKHLREFVKLNSPPSVKGRQLKFKHVHFGGTFPTTLIVHANQDKKIPQNYKRYLINSFRSALGLRSVQLRLLFRKADNPYKDKKNILSERQVKKRKRLIKHIKSSKK
jgi:GTP-binding protein